MANRLMSMTIMYRDLKSCAIQFLSCVLIRLKLHLLKRSKYQFLDWMLKVKS